MASSRSAVIQFSDQQEAQSELQFQDFSHDRGAGDIATLDPSESYTSFPDAGSIDEDEKEELLGGEKKPAPSFWEFSYYQSFFDVDTEQVIQRIIWSMIPLPGRATYLDRQIRPKPDLYGPFWITTTLIFSTAISANIADYLTTEGQNNKIWHYDFHKVSLSATTIYSYASIIPLILWGLMWYRQSSTRYTLLEILCVYGYSLFIYIPISILWVVQVSWLQWILLIVGAALSGSVLLQTFWPTVREENKKIAAVVLCLILLFHTLLAVGFVAYFFRPSHIDKASTIIPAPTISTPHGSQNSSNVEEISNSVKSKLSPPPSDSLQEIAKNARPKNVNSPASLVNEIKEQNEKEVNISHKNSVKERSTAVHNHHLSKESYSQDEHKMSENFNKPKASEYNFENRDNFTRITIHHTSKTDKSVVGKEENKLISM